MNNDKLSDLPEWDDERLRDEEDEGEEWKPNVTREACKALYAQWREVVFVLKGFLHPFLETDDEEMLQDVARQVMGDAYLIAVKIRSSEAGGIYILRMQNAAVIREHAQSISSTLLMFSEEDSVDVNHIEIIRAEINKFRHLFIDWVNSFEKDEFIDEWGLFV